jgi:ABC-type Na+ efflux pump permease subunit
MRFWRRTLPIILCFLIGIFAVAAFFSPHPKMVSWNERVQIWLTIMSNFALAMGLSSLLYVHVGRMMKQTPGWGYSAVTIFALAATSLVGIWWGVETPDEPMKPIVWIYKYLLTPMSATMFSLLAFFIASAAYRAFRARTVEATVLLSAAIILMLGQIFIGDIQLFGDTGTIRDIADVKDWIFENPTMGAQRAINLGIALAVIATSLRIILGIERTYLGGGD